MSTAHLDCHVCRTPLSPEDLSLSHGMAFCRRCQTLIRLDRYQPPRYPDATDSLRPQMVLPEGLEIQQATQGLRIVYRWQFSKASKGILSIACWFWLIMLVLWYARFHFQIDPLFLAHNCFLLLLCVGIWLFSLRIPLWEFLNSTVITVERGCLTVVHTPLPWFRPPPLHTADITQFFVRRVVVYSSRGPRRVFYYEVWAQLRQGQEVNLICGLEAPEQAMFIKQQLETFLGITDRPVPGEWERRS